MSEIVWAWIILGLALFIVVFLMLALPRVEIKTLPECEVPKNSHKLECTINEKEIICKGVLND